VAEAKRSRTDIKLTTGADVQQLVNKIYGSPKPIVDRLRQGLTPK
jgi:hypothetical protein